MGCGIKAAHDDAVELEEALKKVGLKGDKVWGGAVMPVWQELTILKCAKEGMNTEQAIKALHSAKHARLAAKEASEEIEARKLLKQLQEKF